jgi:hypothetical protein
LATEGLDEYFFLHGMLLSADALTSGSPVYRKSHAGRKSGCMWPCASGILCSWDWYFYNGRQDILSVTLLKLEFWFPAVIFKVAGLTRFGFLLQIK